MTSRPAPCTAGRLTAGACAAALLLLLGGCAITSSQENVGEAASLVRRETSQDLVWRRDAAAEQAAEARIVEMLQGGVTAQEAVAITFLASPEVQMLLERLEIGRAELIAASTFPNPVAILGVREPGAGLAAIYGDKDITVGVLQNVLGIINTPVRRKLAKLELRRVRMEVADRVVEIAAEVQEALVQYLGAERIAGLRAQVREVATEGLRSIDAGNDLAVSLERNAVFAAEVASLRANLERDTARQKLTQLMGLGGRHDDWKAAGALPALPAADPDLAALERLALAQRLDIQAAREAVAARVAHLTTTRRMRWLGGLELGWFRQRTIDDTPFDGPNLALELPLFDQRQAEIASRDAEARSAMRNAENLALLARRDVRTHGAELSTTRALLQRYRDDVIPNHRHIVERAAATPDLERIEQFHARQAVLAVEEEEAGLLRDYWRARSALARVAGDWQQLNGWPGR